MQTDPEPSERFDLPGCLHTIPEPLPEEDIMQERTENPLEMPAPKKNILSQVDKTTQVNVEYAEPKRNKSAQDNYKSVTQVVDE